MNSILSTAIVGLAFFVGSIPAKAKPNGPCDNKVSNAEMRQCYAKEQARVNSEVNLLANRIASDFQKEADNPSDGPVVTDLMRKAASSLALAQDHWKDYRDEHCHAVMYTWTTGSGAGTAYEACMLDLARLRLRELRSSFAGL